MKKIIGRPPDETGDNNLFYTADCLPLWRFSNYTIISLSYDDFTFFNKKTQQIEEQKIRNIGKNIIPKGDINDYFILSDSDEENYHQDDNFIGDINYYYFYLKFNDDISTVQANNIVKDFIQQYTLLFNDQPIIELKNGIIYKATGEHLKMIQHKYK